MSTARYNSYFICTSPRSGSTLLCRLLVATGKSGMPASYFHNASISDWLKSLELSRAAFVSDWEALRAVFDAARKQGTGQTGIFGLRMQRGSFDFFMQQIGILQPGLSRDTDRIGAVFGHTLFIHLTRQNKLNQAISRVKETQTGLWHRAADGTELERQSPPREPVYSADEIARNVVALTAFDEAWKLWFGREKIEPLTITYDELSADPAAALTRILDQLGLDRALANDIKPSVAKLADVTNRIWAKRFQTERGNHQNK